MNRLTGDRLWLSGGALVVVAVLVVGWLFFVGPQLTEASGLRHQSADNQRRMSELTRHLAQLRQQYSHLADYQAQLATERQALPTSPLTSDFLRALDTVGHRTGTTINGITVHDPVNIVGNTRVRALPVVVTANGTTAQLTDFIDQLQRAQPRAVLIKMVNLTTGETVGTYTVSLNMNAFIATGS